MKYLLNNGVVIKEDELKMYYDQVVRILGYKDGEDIFENKFCYFMGVYLGDGHISKEKRRFEITVSDGMREYLNEYLKELTVRNDLSGDTYTVYYRSNPSYFKRLKLLCGDNEDKKVPEEIYGSSFENKRYFLAGFFDSDGTIRKTSQDFCNTNFKLITEIANVCEMVGIPTRIKAEETQNRDKLCFRLFMMSGRGTKEFKKLPLKNQFKVKRQKLRRGGKENFGYKIPKKQIDRIRLDFDNKKIKDRLYFYSKGQSNNITFDTIKLINEEKDIDIFKKIEKYNLYFVNIIEQFENECKFSKSM